MKTPLLPHSVGQLVLLLALSCVSLPLAAQRSRAEAAQIAARYIDHLASRSTRATQADEALSRPEAYHLFNDADGQGFVIVAANEALAPVVGYSKSGRIEAGKMPEGLQAYLESYAKSVESGELRVERIDEATLNSHNYPLNSQLSTLNSQLSNLSPLLSTLWDQDHPYNAQCPRLGENGDRAPTGCVATAMAQIMYHHRWPERGKGSAAYDVPYRQGALSYGHLEMDFDKTPFEWNKMAIYPRTADEVHAVSTLMLASGVAVRMQYTPESSAAYIPPMVQAMQTHFAYHARQVMLDNHSARNYLQLLRAELAAGRPVIYVGGEGNAAHAWVCDGYDERGLFHMNWGWGGRSDGYFDLTYLEPYQRGYGGGNGAPFSSAQTFVALYPNRGQAAPWTELPARFDFGARGYLRPARTTTTRTAGLGLEINHLGNFTSVTSIRTRIGVAIYREGDSTSLSAVDIRPGIHDVNYSFGAYLSDLSHHLDLTALSDGRYRVVVVTSNPDFETAWHPTAKPCALTLQVSGEQVEVVERNDLPRLEVARIAPWADIYRAGDVVRFDVVLANRSTIPFSGQITAVLRAGNTEIRQVAGQVQGILDEGTVYRKIDFQLPTNLAAADYQLSLDYNLSSAPENIAGATPTLAVAMPAQLSPVRVVNVEGRAYLQHQRIDCYADGFSLIADSVIALGSQSINLVARCRNIGQADFDGELRYLLRHTATGAEQLIGTRPLTMAAGSSSPGGDIAQPLDASILSLTPGQDYQLVVEATGGGHTYRSIDSRRLRIDRPTAITNTGATSLQLAPMADGSLQIIAPQPLTDLYILSVDGRRLAHRPSLPAGTHAIALPANAPTTLILVARSPVGRIAQRFVRP